MSLFDFEWPAFTGNGRADSIEKAAVTRLKPGSDRQLVYLCGPEGAAQQVEEALEEQCYRVDVPADRRTQYSHCLQFDQGATPQAETLVKLLKEIRTLKPIPDIDHALVLDWYKNPPEGESDEWENTPAGELIYRGKYYKDNGGNHRTKARRELVGQLASVIEQHPLLLESNAIVTVPGSDADGNSFGERLADKVAEAVDKPLIIATCPEGARPSRKENQQYDDPVPVFEVSERLSGGVIIIDDVVRSGKSMRGAAIAARRAGAVHVYALAAVKTRRG